MPCPLDLFLTTQANSFVVIVLTKISLTFLRFFTFCPFLRFFSVSSLFVSFSSETHFWESFHSFQTHFRFISGSFQTHFTQVKPISLKSNLFHSFQIHCRLILNLISWSRISIYWVLFLRRFGNSRETEFAPTLLCSVTILVR